MILFALVFPLVSSAQAGCTRPCNNDWPFGINIDDPFFHATRFDRTAEAGIKTVRLWAWWKWMEPQQGVIDFTSLDAQVAEASAHGLYMMITFVSIPPWANNSSPSCDFWGGQCSAPPTDPSYYHDFVTAVVQRYQGQVYYYGVWNEPNYSIFWDGPYSQYISDILINGSQAIRAADPCARVVGPDTHATQSLFQQALASACSHLDILSFHEYTSTTAGLFNRVANRYKPAMQATGCQKPLWATEFGIDSLVHGDTYQANEYVAAYQDTLQSADLDAIFLYRIDDNEPNENQRLGLVTSNSEGWTRKPSFWSVKNYLDNTHLLCLK